MYSDKLNYTSNHPHWRVEDVFKISTQLARGGLEQNYAIGMHNHDFYEINVVLSGEGTVKDAEESDTKPTYIIENIREIYNRIK